MAAKLAYYLLVLPMSHLPMWILYCFSDFFFVLLISVFPYRKKVITGNLERSFPQRSAKEIASLRRKFYRHFSDLILEGVKNLSISEKELRKRILVQNPEVMEDYASNGKHVLLISGHYGNWEWLIKIQNKLFTHQAYGIGMPMTSKFWDKKVNERRQAFGMRVIHAKNYKSVLQTDPDHLKAVLLLSDQSPGDSRKSYWTTFLNQDTAVLFGAELMTYELSFTPVFYKMRKQKRGIYEMELIPCTLDLSNKQYGELSEWHCKQLESLIEERPEFWLWSHKRWKREVPEDLEKLKIEQHAQFNRRFNA